MPHLSAILLIICLLLPLHPAAAAARAAASERPLLSWVAGGAALAGAAMIALPWLSLAGLLLGLAGLVLALLARRRGQKNIFSFLGLLLGGACAVYFLAVLGLLLFF
jgi:hypothetical protein